MSETAKQLVQAITSGDALGTETAFQAAMAEKISAKLDDMRSHMAQTMFNTQEVEQTAEPAEEIEES